MEFRICAEMNEVDADSWDARLSGGEPWLKHAWLRALQETGPATPETGWRLHLVVAEEEGVLVGALPAWWKAHSMGEFVYDWSWAEFVESVGRRYYPKLVVGVPFTPVPSRRILRAASLSPAEFERVGTALLKRATEEVVRLGGSGVHLLFPTEEEVRLAQSVGWFPRVQTQARFRNPGHERFEDFLETLRARRRKEIRRERRRVREAGVRVEAVSGNDAGPELRAAIWRWYTSTVDQFAWGRRHLTRAFFERVFEEMGEQILLFVARDASGQPCAGTFNLRSESALHGRYWGTDTSLSCLHFEVCYYVRLSITEHLNRVSELRTV